MSEQIESSQEEVVDRKMEYTREEDIKIISDVDSLRDGKVKYKSEAFRDLAEEMGLSEGQVMGRYYSLKAGKSKLGGEEQLPEELQGGVSHKVRGSRKIEDNYVPFDELVSMVEVKELPNGEYKGKFTERRNAAYTLETDRYIYDTIMTLGDGKYGYRMEAIRGLAKELGLRDSQVNARFYDIKKGNIRHYTEPETGDGEKQERDRSNIQRRPTLIFKNEPAPDVSAAAANWHQKREQQQGVLFHNEEAEERAQAREVETMKWQELQEAEKQLKEVENKVRLQMALEVIKPLSKNDTLKLVHILTTKLLNEE